MGKSRSSSSAVAFAALLISATSCSFSLEGYSSGGLPSDAGGDVVASGDGGVSGDAAGDGAASKPRAWRRLGVAGPPALHSARMVYDEARKRTVLYGGVDAASNTSGAVWLWDGTAWSPANVTTTPGQRRATGLVYDSAHKVVRTYGGQNASPEPWEWDGGSAWTSSGASPTSPALTNAAGVAYDRARDVMVIISGARSAPKEFVTNDTWEWAPPTGFVKKNPSTSPPPRRGAVLVYDSARSRVVLFGGLGTADERLSDVWEYDGTTWVNRTPAIGPLGRRGACATYDSVRKVVVLFGGTTDSDMVFASDTWEWDGAAWRQGPPGPPGRRTCAMAFDADRNVVVMYGGAVSRSNFVSAPTDDTWVYE